MSQQGIFPYTLLLSCGFPVGSDHKGYACHTGDPGCIPGWERSLGEKNGYPFFGELPGEFQGQKSLLGYSPRGCKESDMTEQLTLSLYL